MKTISTFHICIIAAFVLITGAGLGVAYYLDGLLTDCLSQISDQKGIVTTATSSGFMPSEQNLNVVGANISLIHGGIDPIIHAQLETSAKKLQAIVNTRPTDWREHLDTTVGALRDEAKKDSVDLPTSNQFYFGFSRFINSNPSQNQTGVLDKQMYAIKGICDILMGDKINRLVGIRRTYEEDQGASSTAPSRPDTDYLAGFGSLSRSESYRSYPLEFDLECSPGVLRDIINHIDAAPDILVIRSVTVVSSQTTSPKKADLVSMADSPDAAPHPTDPGAAAAAPSTPLKGPQFIFGNEYLKVRIRVDLIEWLGDQAPTTANPNAPNTTRTPRSTL